MHNVFHVSLLRDYSDNGVMAQVPPVELGGEHEYEVQAIVDHCICRNERQCLVHFKGYDSSEDMWMNEA